MVCTRPTRATICSSIMHPAIYKYNEQEIEGDSEEEEIDEYSRDNIEEYIAKENEYSEEGINLKKYREYYEN